MKQVFLKSLAINDLNLRYAYKKSEEEIIHYKIEIVQNMVLGRDEVLRAIKNDIEKIEKEPVELIINEANSVPTFQVEKLNFDKKDKVISKLEKKSFKHHINILYKYNNLFGSFLFRLKNFLGLDVRNYLKRQYVGGSILLVVVCNRNDRKKAIELLKEDLNVLFSHGLILGHLSLLSCFELADSIGDGDVREVVFVVPIINLELLATLSSDKDKDKHLVLKELGLKTVTEENNAGSFLNNEALNSRFKITEVNVYELMFDSNQQKVIDSYSNSVEKVNGIAKEAQNLIDCLSRESFVETVKSSNRGSESSKVIIHTNFEK